MLNVKWIAFLENQLGLYASRLFEKGINNFNLLLKLIIIYFIIIKKR